MGRQQSIVYKAMIALSAGALILAACNSAAAPNAGSSPLAPTSASSSGSTSAKGDAIPIGIAVAQTSNVALFGQDQIAGAKIAEKWINDSGGINGTPIKLVLQDTAGDENGAINAFQTLINQSKVVAIVGPTLSQQAFAADPIADKAKVPVVAPSNTAKGIPQIGPYIQRVSAPVNAVAPNALKAALKTNPNIKKVAVAYAQNDAFSKSETVVFQNVITSDLKLELTTVQTFQTTDTDFTTQATNLLNAKVDLVVISGLAADSGNLVKQLRDLGYKGLIVGGNGLNTPNLFPVCKAQCDGIFVAQAYSVSTDNPVNRAFRDAYTADQKKGPSQFAGQAFTGVQVIAEALKAIDSKRKLSGMTLEQIRTDLNSTLKSGMKFTTPLGEISFDSQGEILQTNFYVAQVKMDADGKTGQFVFLNN